jgi:probable rRNA maturation factor
MPRRPRRMAAYPPMSEVEVTNETRYRFREEAVAQVIIRVLAAEDADGVVAVAFLDEGAVAELNGRYRGHAESTDVLSFPAGDTEEADWPEPDGLEDAFLGDVVICPAVAERNALEDEIPLAEEIRRLLVHGGLHLLGYDHVADDGEMRARETALLEQIGAPEGGLLEAENR